MEVPAVPPDLLGASTASEPSAPIRARVVGARTRQAERYARDGVVSNAELAPRLMASHCALDRDARRLLDGAVRTFGLSARAYDRVRKVARTIADLAGADAIAADHVAEALQYRMLS